jgi:hypothetical protein
VTRKYVLSRRAVMVLPLTDLLVVSGFQYPYFAMYSSVFPVSGL